MKRYPHDISGSPEAVRTICMRYRPEEVIETAIDDINRPIFPGMYQTQESKDKHRAKATGINDCLYCMGVISLDDWRANNQRITQA